MENDRAGGDQQPKRDQGGRDRSSGARCPSAQVPTPR
jgi:hypothetical protein